MDERCDKTTGNMAGSSPCNELFLIEWDKRGRSQSGERSVIIPGGTKATTESMGSMVLITKFSMHFRSFVGSSNELCPVVELEIVLVITAVEIRSENIVPYIPKGCGMILSTKEDFHESRALGNNITHLWI